MLRTTVSSFLLGLGVATLLAACSGIPVPPERRDYVGTWQATGVTLTITQDGGIDYSKVSGNGNTKIQAPLKKFVGNDFEVGVMGINTVFKVTRAPYQDAEAGTWKMVVDGIELTRVP